MAKKTQAQKDLEKANEMLSSLGSSFIYSDKRKLGEAYKKAYNDYLNWINNSSKNGLNAYKNDVDSLFSQIINQKKFSYDPQEDKLFQLYKAQYMNEGGRAMKNQMGVASALAGGYNSSVAQTSAQTAYQSYLSALSEKAAETYQNALDMYKYNRQNLFDRYNVARDMNNAGNDAFYKQAEIKAQRMNNAYSTYNDDRSFQYNKYTADRNFYQNQGKSAQDQINWLKEYKLKNKLYKGG